MRKRYLNFFFNFLKILLEQASTLKIFDIVFCRKFYGASFLNLHTTNDKHKTLTKAEILNQSKQNI